MRVQIPAYTDAWMKGDRYGEVTKTLPKKNKDGSYVTIYSVKLDKSGHYVRVIADDCKEV